MAEEPIHDWNSLVNIGDVPMLHNDTNNHHNSHEDYFNFDMKI
jgi:hypothetical protein